MSDCPSGCGRPVSTGKLLCGPCWAEVPRHLQADVMRTWNAYRRIPGGFGSRELQAKRRAARIAYQSARDAAIGSIR